MPTAWLRPGSKTSGAWAPTRAHRLRHSAIVLATTWSGCRMKEEVPCHWWNSMLWADAPAATPATATTIVEIRVLILHHTRAALFPTRSVDPEAQTTTTVWLNCGGRRRPS